MDVAEVQHRGIFPPFLATGIIAAATTASVSAVAGVAKETLYVTKIVVAVTTVDADSITFRDSSNARTAFVVPASAALGSYEVDFGSDGFPLTEGDGLVVIGSGAGVGAAWQAQGYRKATSTRSVAEAKAGVA